MSKLEDEKNINSASSQEVPHELVDDHGEPDKHHGNILDLAARAHVQAVDYDEVESRSVLRRIDWHLMPLLIWICAYILMAQRTRLRD
jgi:hypothetical protein